MAYSKKINGSDWNCHLCDKKNNAWQVGTDSEVTDRDKNSLYLPITSITVFPTIMKTILEKSDSGASRHYLKNEEKGILINMEPSTNQVVNPQNNEFITFSFKGQIPATSVLSKKSQDAHFSEISTLHILYIQYKHVMMGWLLFLIKTNSFSQRYSFIFSRKEITKG